MSKMVGHEEQTVWVPCRCHLPDHLHKYVLTYWEYEDKTERELSAEVFINPTGPWYKRLWLVLRYLFKGALPAGSQFDDLIFQRDDAEKLRHLLDEYLAENDIVWRVGGKKE